MKRNIDKLSQDYFDLLVIGGGINGAAITNLAALNGLSVALVDKGDFASGTSSKSTKLMHGGLRYLENLEFDLVGESLKERFIQLKNIPHLVKPLEFIIPVYKKDARPLWMMKFGVAFYDLLSGRYLIDKHRSLTKEEIFGMIPGIKNEGLVGGVSYFDAQMDDARICLENVLSADKKGACIANYVKVITFIKENGKAVGVKVEDILTKRTFEIRAKKIVCAVGPWTNVFINMERGKGPPPRFV